MTEVAFHFNAEDKAAYTCRLLRKALAKGARLIVLAGTGESRSLSRAVWTMSSGDFVPHCLEGDDPLVKRQSPILIAESGLPDAFQADVLVNLSDQVPSGYERFDRVIEVVGLDEADRNQARGRWRQYQEAGIAPQRHDLKAAAT